MGALISLFAVIVISLVVVRIGGIALAMTGLSRELAMLQAQSAFTGVGFTTAESESVVNHPVRRRIIRMLFSVKGEIKLLWDGYFFDHFEKRQMC